MCVLLELNCRITLVESIPENMTFVKGSPLHLSTFDSWMELINMANNSIDIAAYYWTLQGADIGHVDPSDWQVMVTVIFVTNSF